MDASEHWGPQGERLGSRIDVDREYDMATCLLEYPLGLGCSLLDSFVEKGFRKVTPEILPLNTFFLF